LQSDPHADAAPATPNSLSTVQRIARLEAEIASLTATLQELRTRIELLEPNN
jgi:hypothetical protein